MSVAGQPRRIRFWGWGAGGAHLSEAEQSMIGALARHRFGVTDGPMPVPQQSEFDMPAARVKAPASFAGVVCDLPADRLSHAQGKSFADLARAWERRIDTFPDLVAYPRTEAEVVDVLDWASGAGVAVVPYGGGSSVVGGVTPVVGGRPSLSLDLQHLRDVLYVDALSGTARIQAGVLGPDLAAQLAPHGLSLRHYPQSFEFSSLGGWIATRAGGHFATGRTHIDDFVASVRMITPAGVYESRDLPATGAGPDPVRWVCGSEGAFGVFTEATMRLQPKPAFRASAVVRFGAFADAVTAVRTIVQGGLQPANLRLLDRGEALNALVGDGTADLLLVGFESRAHPVGGLLDQALEVCRSFSGVVPPALRQAQGPSGARAEGVAEVSDSAAAWKGMFLRMPYVRDGLISHGIIAETFETAVPWRSFADLDATVREAVTAAVEATGATAASVTCRFTHVYPDGPAPYYTVMARGRPGSLAAQWQDVKAAASEAIERCGGTITHHHAVGRDHLPWYLRERPQQQGTMIAAAKAAVDPHGIMNPGVLAPLP